MIAMMYMVGIEGSDVESGLCVQPDEYLSRSMLSIERKARRKANQMTKGFTRKGKKLIVF